MLRPVGRFDLARVRENFGQLGRGAEERRNPVAEFALQVTFDRQKARLDELRLGIDASDLDTLRTR